MNDIKYSSFFHKFPYYIFVVIYSYPPIYNRTQQLNYDSIIAITIKFNFYQSTIMHSSENLDMFQLYSFSLFLYWLQHVLLLLLMFDWVVLFIITHCLYISISNFLIIRIFFSTTRYIP